MAYSANDWEIVKAFYEEGLSLSEIVDRPEVKIKDRSSIQKKAAKLGWEKGRISTLLKKEVAAIQTVNEINQEKSTLNSTALMVHETLVTEKAVIASELSKFSLKAIRKGSAMLESIENALEYKMLMDGVDKVSITAGINERHAKPTQIQNNQQNNYSGMDIKELEHEINQIESRRFIEAG